MAQGLRATAPKSKSVTTNSNSNCKWFTHCI